MRTRAQYLRNGLAVLVAIVSLSVAAGRLRAADEPLRWKFKVGEKLDYNMVQEMNMSAAGAAGNMNTTMRQEMNMTWDVQGVDEKTGEAVIKQKFDRVKLKMVGPLGGFEYDSKSEAAPTGLGAMIAPAYKAMTQSDFEFTMTARGEVKDVKVPEEFLTALKALPGAASLGEMTTPEGFKKMISQSPLLLPEKAPTKDETWSTKVESNNAVVGKQTVETMYRYDGTRDIDGTTYAVIKPQLKMEFEKKPDSPETPPAEGEAKQPATPKISMKIAEQSSDGEVLFDIAKGRLSSTTLNQKVTIDATVGGQAMQQKIDQKIELKVTPSGEKKDEKVDEKPESEAKPATAEEKK